MKGVFSPLQFHSLTHTLISSLYNLFPFNSVMAAVRERDTNCLWPQWLGYCPAGARQDVGSSLGSPASPPAPRLSASCCRTPPSCSWGSVPTCSCPAMPRGCSPSWGCGRRSWKSCCKFLWWFCWKEEREGQKKSQVAREPKEDMTRLPLNKQKISVNCGQNHNLNLNGNIQIGKFKFWNLINSNTNVTWEFLQSVNITNTTNTKSFLSLNNS